MRKASTIPTRLASLVAFAALAGCGQGAPEAGSEQTSAAQANAATEGARVEVATQRYHGLFGDTANPNEMTGTYFVADAQPPPMADQFPELPPNAIMIGAMWADVAPWYLVPASETRFEQVFASDFAPPVAAVFELDAAGNATALTIEGLADDRFGRRTRIGDLPEAYR